MAKLPDRVLERVHIECPCGAVAWFDVGPFEPSDPYRVTTRDDARVTARRVLTRHRSGRCECGTAAKLRVVGADGSAVFTEEVA
jgi:hypothetical protein